MFKYVTNLIIITVAILFTGCAKDLQSISNLSYNTGNVNKIREVHYGVIKETKKIIIKDEGKNTIIGGITGALIGSKIGKTKGAAVGAVAGGVLANKITETQGQELTIKLDSNKVILIGVAGNSAVNYLRVKLLIEGSEIIAIEPTSEPLKVSSKKELTLEKLVMQANNTFKKQKNSPEKFKLINDELIL